MSDELVVHQQSMVKPVGDAKSLTEAITAYKEMQMALDKAMPDCIQTIAGKKFRKKNYWRAVKTAFNLKVECVKEEKVYLEDDWGFEVTYKATAPNGSSADGDGACTHAEKDKGNMAATLHNIRSQAHTRAFNRAISNLVGFGEVSAEEVYEKDNAKPQKTKFSEEQKKLFDLFKKEFKTPEKMKEELLARTSFTGSDGNEVKGKDSFFALSDKQAQVVRHILEGELKTKEPKEAVPVKNVDDEGICMKCAKMNDCKLIPEDDYKCKEFVDMSPPEEQTTLEAF
jgi:hypothetical protein